MNRRVIPCLCALLAVLLLTVAMPVAAEPDEGGADTGETTTTTSTTTSEAAGESTTTTTTTTTESTTTTTTTTTESTTTTTTTTTESTEKPTEKPTVTTKPTTTTKPSGTTTTKPSGTTTTTVTSTTTTTGTTAAEPDEPVVTPPTEIAEPFVLVSEPGAEHELVYFCDTAEGHYPQDILNHRDPDTTDAWWVEGRHGLALQLGGAEGRYLRCSRFLFDNDTYGDMAAFTVSMWVNWQGNGTADETIGQKLLCFSTQDLDTRYLKGDRLKWDPDIWYAYVSPHMRDNGAGLDGIYMTFENKNIFTSDEAFGEAKDDTTLALPVGEWHHIAVTLSEDAMRLYVVPKCIPVLCLVAQSCLTLCNPVD